MFVQRQNTNMVQAALSTLELIYHQTVRNLRVGQRNAMLGIVMSIVRSAVFVVGFYVMYYIIGVRHSPIKGDFIVFIMTGIFMYMTHAQAVGAVSGSARSTSAMMLHGPMNTAISITSAALASLYRQTFASFVILYGYSLLIEPVHIDNLRGCFAMFFLAWFSGCCVGLIFLAIRPWQPQAASVLTQIYMRANMIASGKMFVANTMPTFMLSVFDWNPLFHIIDQTRGFAFINYTPHNSNVEYPVKVTVVLLMVGLMLEFVTRRHESVSWKTRA